MGMIVRLYGRGFEENMERDAGVFVQVFLLFVTGFASKTIKVWLLFVNIYNKISGAMGDWNKRRFVCIGTLYMFGASPNTRTHERARTHMHTLLQSLVRIKTYFCNIKKGFISGLKSFFFAFLCHKI